MTLRTFPSIRRRIGLALASLALACGDRPAPPDREALRPARPAAPLELDSAVRTTPTVPIPDVLARACIAGDPDQGEVWRLDSVSAPAIATTAIEALAARDSARFAARVSRLVDVLPSDTSVADFHGLPVSVRAAWRVVPADGDTVVVAIVVRRMPIESEPLEEVFTIVATPGQRNGVRESLLERWFVREVGHEDELVARELVGAFVVRGEPMLAIVEDLGEVVRTALIARRAGQWVSEWAGEIAGCAAP